MIKPLNHRVLIRPVEVKKQTASGIHVVNSTSKPEMRGEIVGASDDVEFVEVGQVVMVKPYANEEVKVGDETLWLVEDRDIIAVCE